MSERRTPEPPSAFDLPAIPEVADEDLAAILAGHKRDHAALQLEYARALSFDPDGRPLECGDPRLVPQLSKELRQNRDRLIAWLSKVEKPKPPEERLLEHPDFSAAIAFVVQLLDDFPEARERIRAGLEERFGVPA